MNTKAHTELLSQSSESFWSKLKNGFLTYLNDKFYLISLLVTAIGSYYFLITNYSISIDDLEGHRYLNGELIAQGRISSSIINRIFQFPENTVSIKDFLGMILLCVGAIMFCMIFDRCIKTKNHIPQTVFSCLFVSYPLHSELFSYTGCFLSVSIGCILNALSILFIMDFFEKKKFRYLLYPVPCLMVIASWYESILLIYVQIVFAILIFRQMSDSKLKLGGVIGKGLIYAAPLAVATGLEYVVSTAVRLSLHLEKSIHAATDLSQRYSRDGTLIENVLGYINTLASRLVLSFLNYMPIQLFIFASALFFVLILIITVKKRKLGIFLCGTGLFLSNFIISMILSNVLTFRTCQSFSYFVAFTFFLLIILICKAAERNNSQPLNIIYKTICILSAVLIAIQVNTISDYFTTDWIRYEYEKMILDDVGKELIKNYDLSKPVIFVGELEMSDEVTARASKAPNPLIYNVLIKVPGLKAKFDKFEIYNCTDPVKIQFTNAQSYLRWARHSFNQEPIIHFLEFIGFSGIKNGTEEQIDEVNSLVNNDLPSWPKEGYITETDKYIIVKLGEIIPEETETQNQNN